MNKVIWSALIACGGVVAALGFNAADAGMAGDKVEYAFTAFGLTMLLTVSLLACLAGTVGLTGMMAWIPGLGGTGAAPQVVADTK